ncbi:MAG: lysophospholipid acyltransferase family protein [Thermodesulfobacteriota bacterium]
MQVAEKEGAIQERHVLGRPIVYRLGIRGIRHFPTWLSYGVAERIADISYFFYKGARENVKKNLRRVFSDMSEKEISSIALRTFRNYSKYLVDYGRFRFLDKDSMFKVIRYIDGEEHIKQAMKKGKGILLLTAHLGNWELGGIFFGRQNIKINVVTLRDGIADIDKIRTRYRKFHNINTIVLGDSPFSSIEVINALHRNEIVAMLVDRYGEEGGTKVEFFGRPTQFPVGPVILGKISGAPIIPAFVVKEGKDSYRAIVGKPIEIPSGGDTKIDLHLQQIVRVFEKYIKLYPDQWYNFVPI